MITFVTNSELQAFNTTSLFQYWIQRSQNSKSEMYFRPYKNICDGVCFKITVSSEKPLIIIAEKLHLWCLIGPKYVSGSYVLKAIKISKAIILLVLRWQICLWWHFFHKFLSLDSFCCFIPQKLLKISYSMIIFI